MWEIRVSRRRVRQTPSTIETHLLSAKHSDRSSVPFFSNTRLSLHMHASPTFSHIMFTHSRSALPRRSSVFIVGDRFASMSDLAT